jgi:hypothetical protein
LRHYTTFTSPIRKYADLIVHRQVLGLISHHAGEDAVQHFIKRAQCLNAHEANHAAFKKAAENMFIIFAGRTDAFTISVDLKSSKCTVSAELDSLRVSRDISHHGISKGVLDDVITAYGQPAHKAKMKWVNAARGLVWFVGVDASCRLACDAESSAVLVYQEKSRNAALIRSGDVINGRIALSKAEPLVRARACVTLELVHQQQQQLALVQQFTSKHNDMATLRQHAKSVAFDDLDAQAEVLGDSK